MTGGLWAPDIETVAEVKKRRVKLLLFLIILILSAIVFIRKPSAISGDGVEYYLMTEAFAGHYDPSITVNDLEDFRKEFARHPDWNDGWRNFFNGIHKQFASGHTFYNEYGLFTDKGNKTYSYHFWFYSLLSSPFYFLLKALGADGLKVFHLVNTLLILAVLWYILFKSSLPFIRSVFAALLFFLSPVLWYLTWTGPEVYSFSLFFLSLILFYEEKFLWSVFFIVLASYHAPPIIFFASIPGLAWIIRKKITPKGTLFLLLSGLLFLFPYLFYYFHFQTFSLITHAGFIQPRLVTPDRFHSYFFDLNQGLIVGGPLLLPLFFILYLRKVYTQKWNVDLLFFPVLLAFVYVVAGQANWNAGCYVIQRYAMWGIPVILVFVIFHLSASRSSLVILTVMTLFQGFWIYQKAYDGSSGYISHKQYVQWIFQNHPEVYNPDPEIFAERTAYREGFSEYDSPFIYWSPGHLKILVHRNRVKELPEQYREEKQLKNLKFVNDWAYIHLHGNF